MIAAVDKLKESSSSQFQILMDQVKSYSTLIAEIGLTPESFQTKTLRFWGLLVKLPILLLTLPLFLFGFVNIMLPVGTAFLFSKKIKDVQFVSSIRFVIGMLLSPITIIIQTLLFWAISGNAIYTLGYLISVLIGAVIAYNWRRYFFAIALDLKFIKLRLSKPDLISKLKALQSSIYSSVQKLLDQ